MVSWPRSNAAILRRLPCRPLRCIGSVGAYFSRAPSSNHARVFRLLIAYSPNIKLLPCAGAVPQLSECDHPGYTV